MSWAAVYWTQPLLRKGEGALIYAWPDVLAKRMHQMDRDTEIAQVNRELETLRERYATYARSSRRLRVVFWIWLPIVALLIVALMVKVLLQDTLMGMFVAGMVAAISLLIWLVGRSQTFRWIDIASVQWSPFSLDASIPSVYHGRRSDAQLIEDQIAERELRLKELGPES